MAQSNVSGPINSEAGFQVNGVAQPVAANSTVSAAAGAANTATITIQLKDGEGNNVVGVKPVDVYLSDASTGIGITGTAASTGLSVASGGGVRLVTAITKSIACVTSATGGLVLSLLDTGKTTYYVVIVVDNGVKVSDQLTTGSYG